MKFSPRKFVKGAILSTAFFVAATGVYSYEIEPNLLKTTTYDLSSAKWPSAMPPLHVAVAADLHVGCPSVGLKRLGEIVERLNALKADIIVLPGDFVTMMGDDKVIGGEYVPPDQIAAVLKGLHAPLGVYAVLGNHDRMNDPEAMRRALENVGIKVMDNDSVHIKSEKHDFWLTGLSDDTTSKPDWKAASAKIDSDAPVIVITHDPGAFVDKNDRPVVMIAGHTHGGQFLPMAGKFFGNPYSRAPLKYLYGHISEGGRDLVVTSGIGTSIIPLRLGAKPEIVDLEIRGAPPPKGPGS